MLSTILIIVLILLLIGALGRLIYILATVGA